MIIIPITVIVILLLINYFRSGGIIRALADTWIELVFFIWAMTELLSVFRIWISFSVLISWTLLLAALLFVIYKKGYVCRLSELWSDKNRVLISYRGYRKWFVVFGIYFLFVLVLGAISSQYNMDSMVYHLPRIMRWMQNRSVWHFAPGIEFQVRYPCLTEYLVAQIYLLGGNDRLANLVQTTAYLGSSVMIFGISRKIGASAKAAFAGAFVYLMMPMAAAQAFTTQTDDVAGMFLLVFIFNILDFIKAERLSMDRQGFFVAIKLAACVMLGYLCKPTICFVMLVFFVWMALTRIYRRDKISVLFKYVVVGAIAALLLYVPLYAKSYQTYTVVDKQLASEAAQSGEGEALAENSVLASAGQALAPDVFNVKYALTNPSRFIMTCLQNLGRNSVSICFPNYNDDWNKLIIKAGNALGEDTSTFRIQEGALFFYHDTASNPWIMILILISGLCVMIRLSRTNKEQTLYVLCAIVGMLLQCGLMGYTQYRTRYLVGAMAVLCPAIAVSIDTLKVKNSYKDIVISLSMFGAVIGGLNTLSYEIPRIKDGLAGSELHEYFLGNPEDEYVYTKLVDIINENGYQKIGLDGTIYMEYPLWQGIDKLERFESVNVSDIYFAQYEDRSFVPDCIIKVVSEEEAVKEGDLLECHDNTYQCIWSMHWYQLYFCLYAQR